MLTLITTTFVGVTNYFNNIEWRTCMHTTKSMVWRTIYTVYIRTTYRVLWITCSCRCEKKCITVFVILTTLYVCEYLYRFSNFRRNRQNLRNRIQNNYRICIIIHAYGIRHFATKIHIFPIFPYTIAHSNI